MALSASTVWEVRFDGSDSNGGGFVTGASGNDYSQQVAARASLTAASTVDATTTIIDVAVGDYTVSTTDVGNILQITGGTATAGFYQITAADTVNNKWTLDRSAGTAGQTVVGAMGGSLSTPGKAAGASVASNVIWLKYNASPYTITSATANVSGGRVDITQALIRFEGYELVRGDLSANRPTIKSTVNTITIFTESNACVCGNFVVDGGTATGITGLSAGAAASGTLTHRVHAQNCNTLAAFTCANGAVLHLCSAQNNTVDGFRMNGATTFACAVRGQGSIGFVAATNSNTCVACVSDVLVNGPGFSNAGASSQLCCINCLTYGGTTTSNANGFANPGGGYSAHWINCLADTNTGTGIGASNATSSHNCAARSNSPNFGVNVLQFGTVTYTDDPFTGGAFHDFTLNNNGPGGAKLRGAGLPVSFPAIISTTGHIDIGASQHLDPSIGQVINSLQAILTLPRSWTVE